MGSDYEAITKYNERKLGEDTSTRKAQVCMYSDETHFVYELLQNADDYGATEVFFHLSRQELIIEHDGQPFHEENVKAITYFGFSTSEADRMKTGHFGVGFKSVFAFTATPIVISDQEHFRIHGLYRVAEHPYPEGFPRDRTRIVLPFNHEAEQPNYVMRHMSAGQAYNKIASRLTDLNMNTLLFTRNIREIRWEIDGTFGHYLREDTPDEEIRHTTITDGQTLNRYLVFSRTPMWHGQPHKDVEIAFRIGDNNQISKIKDCHYVLFATKQRTDLQFILNGPYETNPPREALLEDDEFNRHLMKETCLLIAAALPRLRDRGLLTTQFLGVLPNTEDGLAPFYAPLLTTIVERFRADRLVPTDDGKFASAANVLQGPARIREVITTEEIAFFAGRTTARWAKGIRSKKDTASKRIEAFLESLDIPQWGWKQLEEALESKYAGYCILTDADAAWLDARTDQWLQKLYVLLADTIARNECDEWTIQRCQIVRVTENKKQKHVSGTRAYFPKGRGYQDLPQVKDAIVRGRNKAQTKRIEEALLSLGVRQIGEEERVDLVLETYYRDEDSHVVPKQHLDHMRLFIKWWKKEKEKKKFEHRAIFRSASGQYSVADSCYLDAPLKTSGLGIIYKKPHRGITQKRMLWGGYRALSNDGFCEFAAACGVIASLPIVRQGCYDHPKESYLRQDYIDNNTRFAWETGVNQDFVIPEIGALLRIKEIGVSQLIWDAVRKADTETLEARYRPNQKFDLRSYESSLVLALATARWIPDKVGIFHRPDDITEESLHSSFTYDNHNGWLTAIGFAEKARKNTEIYRKKEEAAKVLDLKIEILEQLEAFPSAEREQMQDEWLEWLKKRAKPVPAPAPLVPFHVALASAFVRDGKHAPVDAPATDAFSRNPTERTKRLRDQIANAVATEPSQATRFSLTLSKRWNGKNPGTRQNLLEWYHGKCQICDRTFRQHNNDWYFEGLYLISRTKAEWVDRPGNVLCLCPWHCAMFQFGAKQVDSDIAATVLAFVPKAAGGNERPAITVTLCGKSKTIKYHENHFLDLKAMILESQKASG